MHVFDGASAPRSRLDGKVAWVAGAGGELGRAVALALAARGVRILVTGTDERAIGVCVGEIAHAGGTARHKVADAAAPDGALQCVEAALERFGQLDIVVAVVEGGAERAAHAFAAAPARMRPGGRLIVVAEGGSEEPAGAFVRALARTASGALTCNALLFRAALAPAIRVCEPEDAAELVVFLCGEAAEALSGGVFALS